MHFAPTKIASLRNALPQTQAIYGFGSRFNGRATADSDWDIALPAEKPFERRLLWEANVALADRLQTDKVDLVDLRSVAIVFRFEILTTAERIYCQDSYFCDMLRVC